MVVESTFYVPPFCRIKASSRDVGAKGKPDERPKSGKLWRPLLLFGEVAERLNAPVANAGSPFGGSGVQIPPSLLLPVPGNLSVSDNIGVSTNGKSAAFEAVVA